MPIYYAIVRNAHSKNDFKKIKLCGRLWAQRFRDAMIEAREYQNTLNEGFPIDWVSEKEPYYTVQAVYHGDAMRLQNFDMFRTRRVTPQPSLIRSEFTEPIISETDKPIYIRRRNR